MLALTANEITPMLAHRFRLKKDAELVLRSVHENSFPQGRKQAVVGNTTYVYDAVSHLVASVQIPVTGTVIEASRERPYLCLCLRLDLDTAELALRHPAAAADPDAPASAIALKPNTPVLLDAVVRLAVLLDAPDDIAALAPLIVREVLYRLLTGPGNASVRQPASANSRLNQIARAIAWIRAHYAGPCRIDNVAEAAGMSRSALHAHFRSVTAMSPLEFRAQLRLQEARRLMVAEALDAASAGYQAGYDSPSQFSGDYAQLFGMPPARHASHLRANGAPWRGSAGGAEPATSTAASESVRKAANLTVRYASARLIYAGFGSGKTVRPLMRMREWAGLSKLAA